MGTFVQNYPFGGQTAAAFFSNVGIVSTNPAYFLQGTEFGAQTTQIIEIAGDFWILKNAIYNGAQFLPVTTTLSAYAIKHAATGAFQVYSVAAGVSPITWTQTWGVDGTGNATFVSVTSSAGVTFPTLTISGTLTATTLTATNATIAGVAPVTTLTSTGSTITITSPSPYVRNIESNPTSGFRVIVNQIAVSANNGWVGVDTAPTVFATLSGVLPVVPLGYSSWRVLVKFRLNNWIQALGGNAFIQAYGIGTASPGTNVMGEYPNQTASGVFPANTHQITGGACVSDGRANASSNNTPAMQVEYSASYAGGATLVFTALGSQGPSAGGSLMGIQGVFTYEAIPQ